MMKAIIASFVLLGALNAKAESVYEGSSKVSIQGSKGFIEIKGDPATVLYYAMTAVAPTGTPDGKAQMKVGEDFSCFVQNSKTSAESVCYVHIVRAETGTGGEQ
ncbi:MAG: hypothetical protein EOP06_05825 [Proteobacteria bacterium]|nr:MAG: hypothetical protein EOP06_05825 [Pseudomonadota bacterium]